MELNHFEVQVNQTTFIPEFFNLWKMKRIFTESVYHLASLFNEGEDGVIYIRLVG